MPTIAQAKQAWNYGKESKENYDKLLPQHKEAFWTYGRDNGYINRDSLDDYKKSEYDKYVKSEYAQYAPKPTASDIQDNLKYDRYAAYSGAKVPLNNKKVSYPVTDTKATPKTTVNTPTKSIPKATLQQSDLFKDLKSTKKQPAKKNSSLLEDIGSGIKSVVYDTPMNLSKEAMKDIGDYVGDTKKFLTAKGDDKGKALKNLLKNQAKRGNDISGTAIANMADTATFGLSTKAADIVTGGKASKNFAKAKQDRPGLSSASGLAGYGAPFKVAGKLVAPVANKIVNTAGKAVAKGIFEGGLVGGAESTSRQLIEKGKVDPKEAVKQAALFGGMGAAGELVGAGLKNVKLLKKTVKAIDRPLDPIGAPAPAKKYTIKSATQDSGMKAYEEAVKRVNDYYGTPNIFEGIKKVDSKRPTNVITKMFDDNTITKTKTAKFLNNVENRTNLSASDYEILDAFYPELVAKHKIPNPSEPVNIFRRVQQDTGVNLQGIMKKLESPNPNLKDISKKQNLAYVSGAADRTTAGIQQPNIFMQRQALEKTVKTPGSATEQPNIFQSMLNTARNKRQPITPPAQPNILTRRMTPEPIQSATKIVSGKNARRSPADWVHKLYTDVVDVTHPTNRLDVKGQTGAESAKVMANNTRAASGTSEYIVKQKLVNRQGKEIGQGLNEILGKVDKDSLNDFNEYLLHRHNVARTKQAKPIFGEAYTSQMSANKAAQLEAAHPEFKQIGKELDEFKRNFSRAWGVDSGMADKALMDQLEKIYPNYVPVYRVTQGTGTGKGGYNLSGNKFIKEATGGNADILAPTESLVSWVDKTVKNARQNEFYNTILDKVLKNPDEMRMKGITITETGQDTIKELVKSQKNLEDMVNFEQLKSDPMKGNTLTVMRNGKPVTLRISDPDVFESLQKSKTGHQTNAIERGARLITNPYKELITGVNPIFAAKNIFRDIPTALVNTRNNPLSYSKNLITGAKDIATNADLYREFQALGGKGGNLVNEGVVDRNPLVRGLRKFNAVTETLPRYAEYKSTVKNAGSDFSKQMEGIYNANDITVNFGRYGDTGKFLDAFAPYLNPSIQGLDKFAQTFKNRPIATALKGATVVTAPILITNYVNSSNPHYKDLDNRTKDTYILIPRMGDLDEKGNPKSFFKIPKAREYGAIFGSLTERILRNIAGEQNSFKGFGNTIGTNFGPVNPLESNIYTPFIDVQTNKDFANRTIVPKSMENRSSEFQYDDTTTPIAKELGKMMNYSPKKLDYLLKSYTGILYQLAAPVVANQPNIFKSVSSQFISTPTYNNQALTDFYDNLDDLNKKAADRNFLDNIPSEQRTKEETWRAIFTKAQKEIAELAKRATKTNSQEEANAIRQKMIDIANTTNNRLK